MRLLKALSLRLLFGVLSLLFISFVTFVADEIAPGDAATVVAGEKASIKEVERLRENMGLNRPWPIRYVEYVGKAATGDFGRSSYGTKEPVSEVIKRSLPYTAINATLAITIASVIGILFGTLAAIWENRAPDRAILTFSTLGVTLPNFVLAPLLVYVFVLQLDYLPLTWEVNRRGSDVLYYILPVLLLSARPTALLTRLTRASMVETLKQEFIRTATAKGVPKGRLMVRHALRNAILPVVTAIGTSFGFLLTGSFVIERFFVIPGLGSATIEAITQGNMPVVQACVLITGAMFILLNLIVDMILPILDPRIRESQV
ncbi:MAG: ABC transporter permease [Fimbriimonas sp.]